MTTLSSRGVCLFVMGKVQAYVPSFKVKPSKFSAVYSIKQFHRNLRNDGSKRKHVGTCNIFTPVLRYQQLICHGVKKNDYIFGHLYI